MGFPHSEIFGSKCAGNSPKLIAACHVLHRLSVPRHPPNALIVLDLTFCQRNDDLAIIISARSVQGTTPTHETAFLPNPSTLPRRQSEDLDFKTSSLPMNDVKERYLRRHTALCSMRWWRQTGSNRRPPACKAGALPTELCPRLSFSVGAICASSSGANRLLPEGRADRATWWAREDLNLRPHAYQARALTS